MPFPIKHRSMTAVTGQPDASSTGASSAALLSSGHFSSLLLSVITLTVSVPVVQVRIIVA